MLKDLDTPVTFEDHGHPALRCPCCGGWYLHQTAVDTVFRGEDSGGTATLSGGVRDGAEVFTVGEDGHPGRRSYMHIWFWCEMCPNIPVLRVFQHKGVTLFSWHQALAVCSPCRLHPETVVEAAFREHWKRIKLGEDV